MYWLMFSSAFLASTILPGGSEVVLVALITQHPNEWIALVALASIGNTLGALTNYALGRLGRVAVTPEQLSKKQYKFALQFFNKYGYWSLLLAWLPIIGDLLCLFAGWTKCNLYASCLMIFIGKTFRYILLAMITFAWV
ncbi:MAG: YqaA family protein [Parashewanella sp.]